MVTIYNSKVTAAVVVIRRWSSNTAYFQSAICTFVNEKGQILNVSVPVHNNYGDIYWQRLLIEKMKTTDNMQFDHTITNYQDLLSISAGVTVVEHIAYVQKKKDL